MAGGHMKYRHLSRSASHREALLRNLVTSLFKHESITTTWHKAKEAQRLAEKLVTLGKKNTEATRRRAHQIFFEPQELVPKLFGPLRERYLNRPGGYTRVLRIEPAKEDQAESAILELVDGTKDMRFHMIAKTLSNLPQNKGLNEITAKNVKKVTQFRKNGMESLRQMVQEMKKQKAANWDDRILPAPKRVYLYEQKPQRLMHYPEPVDDWKLPNPVHLTKFGTSIKRGTRINEAISSLRETTRKFEETVVPNKTRRERRKPRQASAEQSTNA